MYYVNVNKVRLCKQLKEPKAELKIILRKLYKTFSKIYNAIKNQVCPICKNGEKLKKIRSERLNNQKKIRLDRQFYL
jgi:hypothetical protein